ncbi:MAG: cyclase family protein [Balneolaceae bacterium]|nr:cyclase family protein [Balneolaceae bacterium]
MKRVPNISLLIAAAALLLIAGCGPEGAEQPDRRGRIVDLTYAYNDSTVFWPTAEGFQLEKGPEGITEKGYFYSANRFSMAEHGGTHIDAPYHFWKEGHTVDEIPLSRLVGPGIVIDVSDSALANPDYRVARGDFEAWERRHGRIPDGSIVLLKTGFGRYWPDRERYMGTDARGASAVANLHFPGLHPDAASWIATRRKIKMIGIDTPSIDYGQSTHYESHVALFEQNIPALENVANLDRLPATGFRVVALPIKLEGGSGGPARIIAEL